MIVKARPLKKLVRARGPPPPIRLQERLLQRCRRDRVCLQRKETHFAQTKAARIRERHHRQLRADPTKGPLQDRETAGGTGGRGEGAAGERTAERGEEQEPEEGLLKGASRFTSSHVSSFDYRCQKALLERETRRADTSSRGEV